MNWKPSEKKFVEANYLKLNQKQMGKALGRSSDTIRRWMNLWGLERPRRTVETPGPKPMSLRWNTGKHLQDVWK